jgi:hypothetical protein
MNPAWRASAARYEWFLVAAAALRQELPPTVRTDPAREQVAEMSPRVLAFYRATRTANDAFLLTSSHA